MVCVEEIKSQLLALQLPIKFRKISYFYKDEISRINPNFVFPRIKQKKFRKIYEISLDLWPERVSITALQLTQLNYNTVV